MGNGYFRTSQTRKDKRRTKELTYNYVDRVRLAEHSLQHDYKCPTRGSGWRHNSNNNNNKSISHLDLATSCHGAASGANHWSHAHQLRHSRSLDYNHIGERRKDALDIAEFYWRLDPEADVSYDDDVLEEQRNGVDLRQHEPQLYRDYNYADENYHAGNKNSNSIYQQQQHTAANLSSALQAFDFGNESCSLRRSRSLAVIREETFSDLQITSANSSRRRSQLIPRARIVNRGFIRERERLICANHKHHHHHHDGVAAREVLASNGDEQELSDSVGGGTASTCDSHKQQQLQLQQHRHHHHHNQHYIHQQQQQSSHSSAHRQQQHPQSREADDYYDNLKRLDALALGLAEQLHPWHNDKSDLESLNSDYFKNSLHQSHELKQQLDFEALEQAVSFLAGEKPRIYQSRRQQRVGGHAERLPIAQQKLQIAGDSYPENSQSSAFPETTTSNSDDQTDSPSLSEQEYDLKQIETIYKETQLDDDEEGYELISLTTTTRTRIETTEDEDEDEENEARAACKAAERHTSDTEVEFVGGTLKRTRALSENLEKLIAYDSVYLSSEEGSESTFIGESNCEAFERTTHLTAQLEDDGVETSTLLRFSIEDIIYEPQAKQHKVERELAPAEERTKHAEIFEQIRDAEQTTVNVVETLSGRVEKSEKIATTFEKIAVKSAELASESLAPTLYTQILKVGHTTSTTTVPAAAAVANVPKAVSSNTPTPTVGITSSAASKPKILSVVEKRKWKRYTDANSCHNHTNSNEATQRDLSNAVAPTAHSNGEHPYTQLKRQATADSLTYLPFKANLSDNQYHSLPDVNIGQSLKVSECIDAKLRSSYNLHKYQRAAESDAALVDCSLREAKTAATALLENGEQREGAVTSEEIYDSITRFGRAHQKARQKEYEELNEALGEQEKLAKRECKDKRIKLEANETLLEANQATLTAVTTQTPQEYEEIQGSEQVAATEAGSGEIVAELVDESEELSDSLADTQVIGEPIAEQSTDDTQSHNEEPLDFGETPKSAPDIEVANFSKLIERRAKEIKEYAKRQRTLPKTLTDGCGGSAKQPSERQRNKSKEAGSKLAECPAASSAVGEESATSAAFRIIVTDAQNNIIEEDSIVEIAAKGKRETSSGANAWGENSKQGTREKLRELQKETTNTPTWPKCEQISHVKAAITSSNNELHYSSNNNSGKSNTKSTHHAHNRVTTLKRVPSKPKRQQHHQHLHALQGSCCQQQQPDNTASSNNTADSNNSCSTAPGKSKERRVLSTQIYKARPVKVLTNSDSFRRRSGSKMSRPQILHVVDNKRKCDMLGMGNNNNNDSDGSAKVADCQAESEYLKKVDAVRSYWSKLAKDEADRQQQAEEAARAAADEPECERQQPNLRNRKHSSELENCIEPRRQTPPKQQPQQLVEQNQQQTRQAAEQEPPQILQSAQQQKPRPEPRHFILGAPVQSKPSTAAAADNNDNTGNNTRSPDDFCSFMPSIEIVELDGDKTATIVSAAPPDAAALCNDASEPQFDHIRYKVLKSQQLIRSNILARNKKEAQFDGLIQYLQDYSFQELLSNNNVVIVEPVRTKIERPLTMAPTTAANVGHGTAATGATAAKATPTAVTNHQPKAGGQKAAASGASAARRQHAGSTVGGGGGIKRHFFYQPVRVNRELYEEELPNPDVVRNVRKFFEQHILPTPGRGVLVRRIGDSAQTVDDSAVTLQQQQQQQRHHQQQPSPRTRRARKYRYLTIDTSYGHAATQHSKQQQQPTAAARKWDTASLSSGISSGDLSSPCDCNDPDASHAPPSPAAPDQAQEMANALKDVHVQEVVQRHNSCQQRTANSNGDSASLHVAADGGRAGTRPQPRPRSAVGGALADAAEGAYCQLAIYDYNRPAYYAAAAAGSGRFADDADDDDVEDEYEDADMDDELGESYYVSNDVLEKIRECGSSVTYYGGRVLQCSSPDPQLWCGNSAVPSNNNGAQQTANNMTLTRRRARQIETCSVCQPNECPHKQQLQQRFSARAHEQQAPKSEGVDVDKQLPHSAANSEMATTHYGIKFKLVKSNSCSSRLELAGAGAVVLTADAADAMKTEPQPETEVVRKMVHHFESNKQPAAVKKANGENVALEELLTINSQTPAREPDGSSGGGAGTGANEPTKQVTVNNHINVPAMGQPTAVAATLPKMPSHHSNTPTDKQQAADVGGKTYQSSALDIRLSCGAPEKPHECGSADGVGAATKIWRNKNVDLAYTMAKQQQQPKPAKALAASRNDNQSETLHMASTPTATAKPNTAAQTHNCAAAALVVSRTLQTNLPLSNAAAESVDVAAARRTAAGAQATGGGEFKRLENTKSQLTTTESQMPAQIVVPVEIHRVDTDAAKRAPLTPSSSNSNIAAAAPAATTTTTATLVDKSVVRHYVANDKSLFEKRKYDDIEFEEFEVYDPTKDLEKLIESGQEQEGNAADAQRQLDVDVDAARRGRSAAAIDGNSHAVSEFSTPHKAAAVSGERKQHDIDSGADEAPSRGDSDCYDSLEDKL